MFLRLCVEIPLGRIFREAGAVRQGLRHVFGIGGGGGRGTAEVHPEFSCGGRETRPKTYLPRKFRFSSDFVHFILEYRKSPKIKKWRQKKTKMVKSDSGSPDTFPFTALVEEDIA